jgi:hypothetical protein
VAALAGERRKTAIADLERSAPWLWAQFNAARRQNDAANLYFRAGGRFPLTTYGKLNTYALFSETFLQATSPTGRAGFIVPTGIATDDSTKHFFDAVSRGRLVSLWDLRTGPGLFSEIGHQRFKFCLLTLGVAPSADFAFFALQVDDLSDSRRHFQLTPDEFALINPNTRTCPVFRSERDAELTKKLYRAAPVLIVEAETDDEGSVRRPEENPWGISFSQGLFNMTTDSGLFAEKPASGKQYARLPLYEAKMIHQFDHRWATYIESFGGASGEVETADLADAEKEDRSYTVRPRYWVDEREVLARIAGVPMRVSRGWLALHAARDTADDEAKDSALAELLLALAQWVAGELFREAAGLAPTTAGWTPSQAHRYIAPTEVQLESRFPRLWEVLREEGLTAKKALVDFPKWALLNQSARLSNVELATLAEAMSTAPLAESLVILLDRWMDIRSPQWLMGWRDICRSTDERTVIASVLPRVGVGHTMPLLFIEQSPSLGAALLANWCSLVFDYVARNKVGGTHLTYSYLKQFPVVPPDRYSASDLAFVVPRVLELTYSADDLQAWASDLASYDPRPASQQGQPFAWSFERRAQLRAELDAYYARLYGLTRDELRYILDPRDVMGADYPSETFRVLRENEIRTFGEYRTRRLVLDAWDQQASMSSPAQLTKVSYSEHGMIRNAEEGRLAGLVAAVVAERTDGSPLVEIQSVVAGLATAAHHLGPVDGARLEFLREALGIADVVSLLSRVVHIVQRLEASAVLVRFTRNGAPIFTRGSGTPPGDVIVLPEHPEAARLLWLAESRRVALEAEKSGAATEIHKSTGTE